MKKILGAVLGLVLIFLIAGSARASEGQSVLQAATAAGPRCLVNSVFVDTTYHVLTTCRNLITPYSAEVTRYILWYQSSTQKRWVSFGQLKQGKLYSSTNTKFEDLKITAEAASSPREPSENIIASGKIVPYDFDVVITPLVQGTPSPTITPAPQTTPATAASSLSIGNVVKSIAKILIIGFGLLLVGVVVMTFITRRREA